jgi:hypothetical protein
MVTESHANSLRFWKAMEDRLLAWETNWSPISWKPWRAALQGREGVFVLIRGAFILCSVAVVANTNWQSGIGATVRVLAIVLALFFMADILLTHVSIAFSGRPSHPLRSIALSVLSFFEVTLAFGVLYLAAADSFSCVLTWHQAIYFSVVVATTVGFGDIVPKPDALLVQGLVVVELLVSVTFLSVLVARLVSRHSGPA